MGQWFQRFVASGIHGEVSDATIQGYLRSASQLEEVWQQIDDRVDALIVQGMAPWDAYTQMGYALAYVRACRTNVVFVQELVRAAAAANPGYLPRVTYEQALALSEHIEPLLEEAIKASTNPRYSPAVYSFPLKLGPHVGYANQRFPLPHLQGIIAAAQQMRDWAAGLLAKYELALGAAKTPVPPQVAMHLDAMKSELSLGDFHLRTGVDMVGQISSGQVTDELNIKAEGFLWEAMESYFKVSQLVAMPGAPIQSPRAAPGPLRQEPQRPTQVQAQPAPGVNPVVHTPPPPPAPPEPDPSALLSQVIAGPVGTIRPVPVQPSTDESDILNQVIAEPGGGTTQKVPAPASPKAPDLLNELVTNPGPAREAPAQSSPVADGLLNQVTANPDASDESIQSGKSVGARFMATTGLGEADAKGSTSNSPTVSHPGTTQGASPPPTAKTPKAGDSGQHESTSAPDDDLMDMFSQVCGEQQNQ